MPEQNSHKFFRNTGCKYFPCHKNADTENFNCLFCFCPLYTFGSECGGKFAYVENKQKKSVKSCVNCGLPHDLNYYDEIIKKLIQEY